MSDLTKPQENPGADVLKYDLLSQLQHITENPSLYTNAEAEMGELHLKLRALYEHSQIDWYDLWLNHTWEGLAIKAGVSK